jgi:hypothetical protein
MQNAGRLDRFVGEESTISSVSGLQRSLMSLFGVRIQTSPNSPLTGASTEAKIPTTRLMLESFTGGAAAR